MKSRRFSRGIPDNASALHRQLAQLLKEVNPGHVFYYEYPCSQLLTSFLRVKGNTAGSRINQEQEELIRRRVQNLHLDIYDKTMKIAFEVQGQQHDKYTEFFHQDLGGFDRQKTNDRNKRLLCEFVDVKLITVPVTEKISKDVVLNYYGGSNEQ